MTHDRQRIDMSRTVYTFRYFELAARRLSASEHTLDALMSLVASAFFVEAAMNHIGKSVVPYWDSIEHRLDPESKLRVLAHHVTMELEFGKRPLQSFRKLVQLRNVLAHGKTTRVHFEAEHVDGRTLDLRDKERGNWDSILRKRDTGRYFDDARQIVGMLFEKAQIEYPDGVAKLDLGSAVVTYQGQPLDLDSFDFFVELAEYEGESS